MHLVLRLRGCDARLKEEIQPLCDIPCQPLDRARRIMLYSFRYTQEAREGDSTKHFGLSSDVQIGVMAQEIIKVRRQRR